MNVIPIFRLIIPASEIQCSWDWFTKNINPRPLTVVTGEKYIYDKKSWDYPVFIKALDCTNITQCKHIANLFITSLITSSSNDLDPLFQNNPKDIGIFAQHLDVDLQKMIKTKKRFRYALSEHMAFWIQCAHIDKLPKNGHSHVSLPNYKPENTGPDGLLLTIDNNNYSTVEIRSVKCSISNPRSLIVRQEFINDPKTAKPNHQLEEFYCIVINQYGLILITRMLADAYYHIGLSATEELRAAVLTKSKSFNALVFGNDKYSDRGLFDGYHIISTKPEECIATYIGFDIWENFAENVRNEVLNILNNSGVC